jgi:hypothetical protein
MGRPPARDLRQVDARERKWPGKKDRKRWCRGKAGVEHQYSAVVLRSWWPCADRAAWLIGELERGAEGERRRHWWATVCAHTLACSVCGKHGGDGVEIVDCPDLGEDVRERIRRLLEAEKEGAGS